MRLDSEYPLSNVGGLNVLIVDACRQETLTVSGHLAGLTSEYLCIHGFTAVPTGIHVILPCPL